MTRYLYSTPRCCAASMCGSIIINYLVGIYCAYHNNSLKPR